MPAALMHNASTGPGNKSLIQGWKGGKIAPTALCTVGAIRVAKSLSSADTRPWRAEEPQERETSRSEDGHRESQATCCHPLHFHTFHSPHKIASSPFLLPPLLPPPTLSAPSALRRIGFHFISHLDSCSSAVCLVKDLQVVIETIFWL